MEVDRTIKIVSPGKLQGFANTLIMTGNIRCKPNALTWKKVPPLTRAFEDFTLAESRTEIGKITKLEYRDGELWCEADVAMCHVPAYPVAFGVAFFLSRYRYDKRNVLIVASGELVEVAIIPFDEK